MTDQYVGEIRAVTFNFAPTGWALCNGQLLPINQNTALFSLLGTYYGGDGRVTFALPDLRDRTPMHWGDGPGLTSSFVGEWGGAASVALGPNEMPQHQHPFAVADTSGDTNSPAAAGYGVARYGRVADRQYAPAGAPVTMHPLALGVAGQGFPHNNMPPFLALNFIIALQGSFPPRP
jgi:microcystin-dependent protein